MEESASMALGIGSGCVRQGFKSPYPSKSSKGKIIFITL